MKPQEAPQVKTELTAEAQAEPPSIELVKPAYDLSKKEDLKKFAQEKVKETFGDGQWEAFDKLITKESGWNVKAKNPHSTAFGLGQFLASTQKNYGIEGCTDPEKQLLATIQYVKDRYNNPFGAWNYHLAKGWY